MEKKPKLRASAQPPEQTSGRLRSRTAGPAALSFRISFGERTWLGPGKIRLMELIAEHGSISAAGKAMGMSYRRAWLLVDAVNTTFAEPLVAKQTGGSGGGGAALTAFGREVVDRYRRIERTAAKEFADDLKTLSAALR